MADATAPILSDPTYTTSTVKPKTTNNKTLGQEDFLNLLVAQLKYQDPLNPMQDKDFIAQLATFSNLQQATTMNKNMDTFIKQQQYMNTLSASAMIGKSVKSLDNTTGIVSSVQVGDKGVSLSTVDGTQIAFDRIKEIKDPYF